MRLDWRSNWALWQMAIRHDDSVIAFSSAKHISHLFAHISSKFAFGILFVLDPFVNHRFFETEIFFRSDGVGKK